jgi:CBS domain-containing protein
VPVTVTPLLPSVVSELSIRDEFASIAAKSTLNEVSRILAKNEVKAILVVDRGKREAIGILTEQQFLLACATGINPNRAIVDDYMQTNILRLRDNTPVDAVLRLVEEKNPDAVIVMTGKRAFKGYLSPQDFRELKQQLSLKEEVEDAVMTSRNDMKQRRASREILRQRPSTPTPFHRIPTTDTTKAGDKGQDSLLSDASQLVKLALHFCSDDGRRRQAASRTGIRHEHLFCIGKSGPFDTRGVWVVDEEEIENIIQNSTSTSSEISDDLYCLTWLTDEDGQIPPLWLSKVESIWKDNLGEYQLNCLVMNQSNFLMKPEVIAIQKPSKGNIRKAQKSGSVSQIESLANNLIQHNSIQNKSHNRILLCASVRAK